MAGRNDGTIRCSFCGKEQDQVRKLISGPRGAYICDECIEVCMEILDDELEYETEDSSLEGITLHKPKEIKAFLDEYVIGQEEAKKVLSVAVYNHYKRIMAQKDLGVELQKSNILMLGPTGCGKTLLAQSLARILNVPFAIADATALTEAGYVGEDVENILLKIIQAADGDIQRAEYGIIYIDEIDKIARKGEGTSITRDVSGEGVQQALLKIIEGADVDVPVAGGRKHPQGERVRINTSNILFICGGAFEGLTMKTDVEKHVGFCHEINKSSDDDNTEVTAEVLKKQGLIPELIGRLPIIVRLNELTVDDLEKILVDTKNSIVKQYKELIELDGVELDIDKSAIHHIAKEAHEKKTGARGLKSIIEKIMRDVMFDIPSENDVNKVTITVKDDKLSVVKAKSKDMVA